MVNKLDLSVKSKYALSGKNFTDSFLAFHKKLLLSDIKEALSVRRQEESGGDSLVSSVEYELPDHQSITINRSDIKDKFIIGDEDHGFKGAAIMAGESASSCDVDIKKELYSNILLTGGNILYGSYVEEMVAKIG